MALDIKGDSFAGRYKRVNDYPIDTTDIWDTYDHALVYARNTDSVAYVPYAGQIISVVENGAIYKLEKDDSVSEADGKKHFKLALIGSKNDNDDRYVRKDIAETIKKLMTFLEGINVKGMATLEEITLLRNIVSQNFSAGSTGFGIYRDEDGNYHLDIDFVNIRRKLTADEIQVQQSSYIGGKQWNTAAGMICSAVEDKGTYWRCYFKTTDAEGRTVRNTFEKDDQAICETFNLDKQASGVLGNHYYWRLVANKPGDDYIDLSKSDCDAGSDAPQVGDNIVQLGNRTDASRQGAICWDSVTAGGPYVRVYKGINSYHLPQPNIDLNPEESIIKAKLTSIATGEDIDTVLEDMQDRIELVKKQTDKEYTLWFFDYVPTLSNIPASEWTTAELKDMHDQDMFYNRLTGKGYRFESGIWNEITDHLTLKALEDAAKAQDTADGKRRTFVAQPTDSQEYDEGDLWVNATYSDDNISYNNDSLVCKTAKAKGAAFSIDHWKPVSTATTAYLENLGDRITAGATGSAEGIEAIRKLAQEGIDDAYDAAQSAAEALGIAQSAQSAATENTTVIQATKDDIALFAKGIHFDTSGKITNINTSGLVTTDDFNVLLSKKVNFDSGGHITNISTSGLVTEAEFVKMFDARADANGYVKSSEISLFITEDEAGHLISNAQIDADQIRFNGNIVANGTFVVDTEGNLTLNKITANNGIFNGVLNAVSGTFSELSAQFTYGDYVLLTSITPNEIIIGRSNELQTLLSLRAEYASNTWGSVMKMKGNVRGIVSEIEIGYDNIIISSRDITAPLKSVNISPNGISFYSNDILTKSYSAT